jgi:hypothetical protein
VSWSKHEGQRPSERISSARERRDPRRGSQRDSLCRAAPRRALRDGSPVRAAKGVHRRGSSNRSGLGICARARLVPGVRFADVSRVERPLAPFRQPRGVSLGFVFLRRVRHRLLPSLAVGRRRLVTSCRPRALMIDVMETVAPKRSDTKALQVVADVRVKKTETR